MEPSILKPKLYNTKDWHTVVVVPPLVSIVPYLRYLGSMAQSVLGGWKPVLPHVVGTQLYRAMGIYSTESQHRVVTMSLLVLMYDTQVVWFSTWCSTCILVSPRPTLVQPKFNVMSWCQDDSWRCPKVFQSDLNQPIFNQKSTSYFDIRTTSASDVILTLYFGHKVTQKWLIHYPFTKVLKIHHNRAKILYLKGMEN
jgi:hypothetical protein